jgi:hypothetical protein
MNYRRHLFFLTVLSLGISGCSRSVPRHTLEPISLKALEPAAAGYFSVPNGSAPPARLHLDWEEDFWRIRIEQGDEILLPSTPVSPYPFALGQQVFQADLSGDGRQDLLLHLYVGGVGLNAVSHLQAFVFNTAQGYDVRILEGYDVPEPQFFRKGPKVAMIHRDLFWSPRTDGRFWTEQLLIIRDHDLETAVHPDFPRVGSADARPRSEAPPPEALPEAPPRFLPPAIFFEDIILPL